MNARHEAAVFPRHGLFRAILLFFCLAAASFGATANACAHAALVSATPADGATLAAPSPSFSLTFSEPVSPLVLTLIRPDGAVIALDRFTLHDTRLAIETPAGLVDGTHVLNWRIVSEDGHPVGGSVLFSIGAPSATAPAPRTEAADMPLRGAIWLARIGLYLGLFIGVGGVFFTGWIGGRTKAAGRTALMAIGAGFAATPLSVCLQGRDALGLPLGAPMTPAIWTAGLSTSYGLMATIAMAAFTTALLAAAIGGSAGKALSLAGLMATGAALAASGHASAADPQWLTRPAVFLHGVGIAFWAGSLAPLAATFAHHGPDAALALRRFSRIAPLAVLPMAAAGLLLAAIQLQSPEALFATAYGRVLLAKALLLLALFFLAAINRFRLTAPAERGDPKAMKWLRRSIRIEVALVLAIFAVAALWRFTPPPRSLVEAAGAPAFVHLHTGKAMAEITVTPGKRGPSAASIVLMTANFDPLAAKEVTLILANPQAGIEQIRRPAKKAENGTWRIDGLDLPVGGQWNARIDILVSDFEIVRVDGQIEIAP